jgi:hypothetical protein
MQHGGHQLPVPMGSQLQNHPPPAPTTQIESNISASTGRLSQTTTAPLTSKSVSQAQAMAMSQSQQMPVHGSMWMPAYGQHAATVPPYGPGMVPTDMAQSMSTAQYPIPAHPMAYPGMMGMYTPHHFGLPQHQIPYQTPQQSSSVQVDQRQSQQPASEEKEDLLISFD